MFDWPWWLTALAWFNLAGFLLVTLAAKPDA
jgi:hypothetical protein